MVGHDRGILIGSGVTPKEVDPMAMTLVERNNLLCCCKKSFRRFVFDQDRMTITTEKIFVNKVTSEAADRNGAD